MNEAALAEVESLPLEIEHYHAMADEMLKCIVQENRPANFSEKTFFKSKLGWDDREVNRQVRRMHNLLRLVAIVGREADREAAYDENEKAHEVLENEGPKLDKRIQALVEQKSQLERAATSASRRCEQIDTAVAEVTKLELLRADLAEKHNGLKQQFAASHWGEMNALKVEIDFREQLLSMPMGDALIEHLRRVYPDCCQRSEHYIGRTEIVGSAWENRKQILRQELSEMVPQYEQLQVVRAEQEAQLEEIKGFYLKENG